MEKRGVTMKLTKVRTLVAAGVIGVTGIAGIVGVTSVAGAQTTDQVAAASQGRGSFLKSLTDEQKACLQANGVAKPEGRLSPEQRREAITTLRTAADTCGITLPERPGRARVDELKSRLGSLTPEQKACMKDSGLTRPQRPMDAAARQAWIAQAKQAAQACGLAGA
jgi:hypothetical protein